MGKGIIDDTNKYYVDVYNGGPSRPGVQDAFDKHDFVLVLGNLPSDTNAGGFTRIVPHNAAYVNAHDTVIRGWKTHGKVPIKAVL